MLSPVNGAPTDASNDALGALLDRLDIHAEKRIEFVETRHSDLLDEPLEVRGVLYRKDKQLVRETTSPREETHTLSERHVEIRNPAGHRQRFSLRRAPELGVLRQALLAILEQDPEGLDQHFSSTITEEDADWTLTLVPTDEDLGKRVERLELFGAEHRIEGMRMVLDDGEVIETHFKSDP